MTKIGFTADNEEDNKRIDREDSELKMIADFINQRYSPSGSSTQICFKTSREIAYELREMTLTTIINVSRAMRKANYEIKIIGDTPHWVMYDMTIHF